ncbi:MAG: hypothetical protein ACP5NW_04805 [Candidatus Woesearchaeota archaeon]
MKNIISVRVMMLTAFILLLLVASFIIPKGIAPNIPGPNYKNVTVWTYVNITNAKPEVLNVTIYDPTNITLRNFTVAAGSTKTIYCNGTVRDWDGYNDVIHVNASLWHNATSNYDSSDNNNSHYTNSSCTNNLSLNGFMVWYVCSFDVYYYSNNGTWLCNITAMDNYNKTGNRTGNTTFLPVYALNVTDGIDYGNVAVESSSSDISANITNLGNMAINISVEGYGARKGDGLAMNCTVGNISVSNERFSLNNTTPWSDKTPLTSGTVTNMSGLTIPKQTVPNTYMVNESFWQLYIPPNPAGNCSGFIIFTAVAP